jgi:hypothetical protein
MNEPREQLLSAISEIQQIWPPELVEAMWFTPVGPGDVDELLARAVSIFSPVFLPLWERDGNLWAVHVRPGVPWQNGPWVMLPHDAAGPQPIASSLRYLPAGLLVPPHTIPPRLDAVWDALGAFEERVPAAARPEQAPFVGALGPDPALRMRFDPLDGAARAAAIRWDRSDDEIRAAAEDALAALPDDPYVLTINAVLRARLGFGDPTEPALRVLPQEVPLGIGYVTMLLMAEAAPELLEVARTHAAPGISETDLLVPLRTASYTDPHTAPVLRQIGERYRALGDEMAALNQLRNGAAVAAWSQTLDEEWCRALAEQADRVEPGCISAALARHAAEVIGQGP